MGLETAAADHACNVVRRQVQEEFPDLTLLYIVHHGGQREKPLDAKRAEVRQHPAGEAFLPYLAHLAPRESPEFSGISIAKEKKFMGLLSREKTLACFFVNADRLETPDEARRHALALSWQALALLDDYKNERKDYFTESANIIIPKQDKVLRAWKNMLADAFSVLVLEMEKRRDSIGRLGRSRSQAALSAVAGARPEHHPFPLVFDATRLVFNDMAKIASPLGPVHRAVQMTREIGETFDAPSVKQWWAFTRPAQEMAWMGAEEKTILGAAVYSSEDPYARATAYLVAEALNIQTLTPSSPGAYNPFAEPETSERHHLKACEESFRIAIDKANMQNSSQAFLDEAEKHNKRLLGGNPIGWAAYPLLCAEVAFRNSPTQAKVIYDKAITEVPWQKVHDIMHLIVTLRREGLTVTPALMAEKLQETEELKFLAPCFMSRTA